jgi:hypothetical protein
VLKIAQCVFGESSPRVLCARERFCARCNGEDFRISSRALRADQSLWLRQRQDLQPDPLALPKALPDFATAAAPWSAAERTSSRFTGSSTLERKNRPSRSPLREH